METNSELFGYAKRLLINIIPQSISLFSEEDGAYILYAEFADFLISNLDNEEIITKGITVIDKLLEEKHDTLEELIVIQVFQKIYVDEHKVSKFRKYLSGDTLAIFEQFLIEFNRPVDIHPSLRKPDDFK